VGRLFVPKYEKPIWKLVLEAAQHVNKKVFMSKDIVQKVHEKYPEVPTTSIRTYVIAMAPNHPTSHHYPATHRLHRYFFYLGSGKFRLKGEEENLQCFQKQRKIKPVKNNIESGKEEFLKGHTDSILTWIEENFKALISGRRGYSWNDKPLIECIEERNLISDLIVKSRIKNNGGLDIKTWNKVMAWGGLRPFPIDDNQLVIEITSKAFSFLDKGEVKKAIFEILSINKVGIASTSKIIGLFDQNRLAIYDSRVGTALRTLMHNGKRIIKCPAGRSRKGDTCTNKQWATDYEKLIWVLETIRNKLNEKGYPFSIADVEMALFMMGK
jgi:hypothetical protein